MDYWVRISVVGSAENPETLGVMLETVMASHGVHGKVVHVEKKKESGN